MLGKGLIYLTKIQAYLQAANKGAPGMSEEIIEEAAEQFKAVLRKTFNEVRKDDFKLSMSNAGKPACQLTMQRDKAPVKAKSYSFTSRMLFGDVLELLLRAIVKSCGINIDKSTQRVQVDLGGIKLGGTYDDKIDGAIWDTKSASGYSCRNKWAKGFSALEQDDTFGYIGQLYGYAEADKAKVGGWLVWNKENGEILAVEAQDDPVLRKKHLVKLEENVIKVIDPSRPFTREFQDEPEFFRKKPTGNRKLGYTCSECDYNTSCWPGLVRKQAVKSEASNPPVVYYTVFNEDSVKTEEEETALREKKVARKAKKNANF